MIYNEWPIVHISLQLRTIQAVSNMDAVIMNRPILTNAPQKMTKLLATVQEANAYLQNLQSTLPIISLELKLPLVLLWSWQSWTKLLLEWYLDNFFRLWNKDMFFVKLVEFRTFQYQLHFFAENWFLTEKGINPTWKRYENWFRGAFTNYVDLAGLNGMKIFPYFRKEILSQMSTRHYEFLEYWNTQKKCLEDLTTFFMSTWWGDSKNMK